MGITFRYWLIANFEIIAYALSLFICTILALIFADLRSAFGWTITSVFFLGILTFPGYSIKSIVWPIIKYILVIAVGILITIAVVNKSIKFIAFIYFWTVFVVASFFSLLIAIFTYKNINQVFSRRMLYRSSSIDIFNYSWQYTLGRFFNIAVSIFVSVLWILITVFFGLTGFITEILDMS